MKKNNTAERSSVTQTDINHEHITQILKYVSNIMGL